MTHRTSHPTVEAWSDFLRATLIESEAGALQAHLDAGCQLCSARLSTLETIQTLARSERGLDLPDGVVRSVKATFRVHQTLGQARQDGPRLVFDSRRLAAAAAGLRAGERPDRHLMYASDRLSVDLKLQSRDRGTMRVQGELFALGKGQLSDVPVFLINQRRIQRLATSGQMGQFTFDCEDVEGLRLAVQPPNEEAVEIAIPSSGREP